MKTKVINILSSIKRLRTDLRINKDVSKCVDTEQSNERINDGKSFDDVLCSIGK